MLLVTLMLVSQCKWRAFPSWRTILWTMLVYKCTFSAAGHHGEWMGRHSVATEEGFAESMAPSLQPHRFLLGLFSSPLLGLRFAISRPMLLVPRDLSDLSQADTERCHSLALSSRLISTWGIKHKPNVADKALRGPAPAFPDSFMFMPLLP